MGSLHAKRSPSRQLSKRQSSHTITSEQDATHFQMTIVIPSKGNKHLLNTFFKNEDVYEHHTVATFLITKLGRSVGCGASSVSWEPV